MTPTVDGRDVRGVATFPMWIATYHFYDTQLRIIAPRISLAYNALNSVNVTT